MKCHGNYNIFKHLMSVCVYICTRFLLKKKQNWNRIYPVKMNNEWNIIFLQIVRLDWHAYFDEF